MIHEKQIQYLLMVAQEQNITTAARKLYVSQPALSRMILDLEQQLGTPLFFRERGALRPTPAGEVYLQGCREVLAIDRSVKREISDLSGGLRGKITLAVTSLTEEFLLPHILGAFDAAYPNVQLDLMEERMQNMSGLVRDGKADLALVRTQGEPELSYTLVMENPVYLQVPPAYAAAHPEFRPGIQNPAIPPEVLHGQPVILLKKGRGLREGADRLFLQYSITPSTVLETDNLHVAHGLTQLNKGFTFVPSFAVRDFFHDDASSFYCPLKGYSFVRPLYCCYARHRYLTKAEHFLIQLISDASAGESRPSDTSG